MFQIKRLVEICSPGTYCTVIASSFENKLRWAPLRKSLDKNIDSLFVLYDRINISCSRKTGTLKTIINKSFLNYFKILFHG